MRATAALGLLLLLGACAWLQERAPLTADDHLRIACDSYAGTLNALAVQRELGHLSAEQIRSVDQTIALLSPTCTGAPGASVSLETLEAHLIRLIEAKEQAQR